ncbi:fasciclin domain-containing protein [Dyella flava]|uniref:Fasciclin domain-containing protein n=1 Tax=Dyella flava TaxID=1920170 RepID=A0ABS2JYF4_9GAMM|nr:fasciclin domain-containing protein [Dyella flava]MBM7124016.1 fasciclin domain-containing protein [Dyella flava]GLQ50535.1 Nex18 symbiotically induced protein [Dyella flava]
MSTHVNNHVPNDNLIDSVDALGSFAVLRKVLDAAGLSVMLSASGPYTLFAPNDRAFAKLPKGTVEDWLRPESRDELLSVLKYHIFPGFASSADVGTMSHPRMLQGQSAVITKEGDKIRIDGANLIGVDIVSSNGVIHMIDTVMQPIEPSTRH